MKSIYPLILLSVAISAFAQIALKAGMASASVQRAIADGTPVTMLLGIALNPFVLFGLFLYFSSAAVWLFVLSRVQVSFAYPFVALGFVLTALFGRFFFQDTFSTAKIAGTLLIMAGVVVMARA
ncbi:MAG: EamA family transporter [Sphingomonadales bacterium]|nr:EamA family transporter [Sphingomonadales bacterium]